MAGTTAPAATTSAPLSSPPHPLPQSTLPSAAFRIDIATSAPDLEAVAALFREYAAGLGIDLAFQAFAAELAGLPGQYAPPRGVLLLARRVEVEGRGSVGGVEDAEHVEDGKHVDAGRALGCVALRPLPLTGAADDDTAPRSELKRLYVRPEARGSGLGETLARRALDEAAARGYGHVVMDTLSWMAPARRLYHKLGFAETTAYYTTPIAETVFYHKALP